MARQITMLIEEEDRSQTCSADNWKQAPLLHWMPNRDSETYADLPRRSSLIPAAPVTDLIDRRDPADPGTVTSSGRIDLIDHRDPGDPRL